MIDEELLRRKVKAELRKRMRGLRNSTPESAILARSAKIIERLEATDAVKAAKSIALFWPITSRHEVDLRAFDESIRKRAKVAYPTIDAEHRMTFRFVDDPSAMTDAGMGFLQPAESAPLAEALDVIIVPALAVDPRGHRLGYGAGYYDRALAAMPAATSIAVAFDFQLLAEIPITATDVAVKWIVTDSRTFEAS
jgi:5-formyltetrahydrofolate cyclo-ligase